MRLIEILILPTKPTLTPTMSVSAFGLVTAIPTPTLNLIPKTTAIATRVAPISATRIAATTASGRSIPVRAGKKQPSLKPPYADSDRVRNRDADADRDHDRDRDNDHATDRDIDRDIDNGRDTDRDTDRDQDCDRDRDRGIIHSGLGKTFFIRSFLHSI